MEKLALRLNNQARRPTGVGMTVDIAVAKEVLESFPRIISDDVVFHQYTNAARAIYKAYPPLRAMIPLSRVVDYLQLQFMEPKNNLYLELLPTYLLTAPQFAVTPMNLKSVGEAACCIASLMGMPIVQFTKLDEYDVEGESGEEEDDGEDEDEKKATEKTARKRKRKKKRTVCSLRRTEQSMARALCP
jgi:hypothetical protein